MVQVLISFFPIVLLATFQFTLKNTRPQGIAGVVFTAIVLGMFTATIYAYLYRLRGGKLRLIKESRLISFERRLGFLPWCSITAGPKPPPSTIATIATIPWWKLSIENNNQERTSAHREDIFTRRFGWLSAKYRRRQWWFFGPWLVYEFLRALFYGGGQNNSKAQVFGLLALEIIALSVLAFTSPFQSMRSVHSNSIPSIIPASRS